MPNKRQTSPMMHPSTSLPWSLRIERGMPNRLNTCSTSTLAMVSASLLRSGKASAHLVNESMHVSIHKCPCSDFGCGPVRSMYQRSKGAPGTTGCNGPCFRSFPRWYRLHCRHCRQKRRTSVSLPVIPVEASSNLFHDLLFSKVSTDHTGMTLIENIRYVFAWE